MTVPVRLGLRSNARQFALLVALNALVGGTEMIAEQALLLTVLSDERGNDVVELRSNTSGHRAVLGRVQ